ncbi:MAG: hypothetical protein H7Y00_09525, partial [Fimbriimonadaceae bacterium]|nr:hypothetical protein [Chitinophagales bacterium]
RWQIDEYTINEVYTTEDTTLVEFTGYDDVGEMIFYEAGTGVLIQYDTILLVKVARYYEWENTDNQLSFQFDDIPVTDPELVYDIVSSSDDSIRLRLETQKDSLGFPLNITTELLLQRADELSHF